MSNRFIPLLAFLLAILCPGAGASAAQAPTSAFAITSVTYTDANGRMQTVKFVKGKGKIPAIAVKNPIVLNGTYAPNDALVTGTPTVYQKPDTVTFSSDPKLSAGSWTATIPAKTLTPDARWTIGYNVNGADVNTAIVNSIVVKVAPQTLEVAAP
jgi:hypothetical protein